MKTCIKYLTEMFCAQFLKWCVSVTFIRIVKVSVYERNLALIITSIKNVLDYIVVVCFTTYVLVNLGFYVNNKKTMLQGQNIVC